MASTILFLIGTYANFHMYKKTVKRSRIKPEGTGMAGNTMNSLFDELKEVLQEAIDFEQRKAETPYLKEFPLK